MHWNMSSGWFRDHLEALPKIIMGLELALFGVLISGNVLNCRCMSRFDTYGTSKNDNFPKVLVGHGLKKYGIKNLFTM